MPKQKIALVTGANRGIGLEVCRQLAQQEYLVIITSRSVEVGQAAMAQLEADGLLVRYHQLDVSDTASIERLAAWLDTEYGYLDALVNNAGINYDSWHNALNADLEECQTTIDVNLFGPWRMIQACADLLRQGTQARIVNVSSGAGAINGMGGGTPAYSISKAALNVLTIKVAAQFRSDKVLVNAICPGWVRTDMGGDSAPRSVAEGASGIVWAATLPAGGPSGGFFRDGQPIAW